ncbi:MAG TPA: SRPBCC family protein [Actinomycetes bacterium]|nr:SRPBCC family protein [Actinomycetes bacterium]
MNRKSYQPGPMVEVSAQAGPEGWTLTFVRELRHPRDAVWAALTDPRQLGEWAPYTASRDLGTVGDATLTMIDGDTAEEVPSKVTRADPPELLEHTFGTDLLRWELTGTDYGTRLTLWHTVGDRDWLAKVAAGWHICLDVAERMLDGRPVGAIRGQEALQYGWEELRTAYADRLGSAVGSG